MLGETREIERKRRDLTRDVLRKLVVYETAWLRNYQYETEKMAQVVCMQIMEGINVEKDLDLLQLSSITLPAVHYKHCISDTGRPDSSLEDLISPIGKLRRATGRLFSLPGEDKSSVFLTSQFEKASEGLSLRLDEEFVLHTLLKEEIGRKHWVSCLSKRVMKDASVSRCGLGKLAYQLRILLHESTRHKEAELVLSVMLSAQKVTARTSERESLLLHVAGMEVWRQDWVWEKASKGGYGNMQCVQEHMELLGLTPEYIQKALGTYVRKPSYSVVCRSYIPPKRIGGGKWRPEVTSQTTDFRLNPTVVRGVQVEARDTDPTEDEIDLDSPEITCIPSFVPFPEDKFQAAKKEQISRFIQVTNLPNDADPPLLRSFFSPCGQVQSLRLQSFNSAILEFETTREAEKAVNLTGFDLHDCILTVKFCAETLIK